MKLFKITFLILITSISVKAQIEREQVYSKTFNTDKHTTILLDLEGTTVKIESSPDDKFYIEYIIEFENFSDKRKKNILERINVEASMINNHITLKDVSRTFGSGYFYNYLLGYAKSKNDTSEKVYKQKSKNLVLKEINEFDMLDPYVGYINRSINSEEEKAKRIERFYRKRKRTQKKDFVIKVPKNLYLTINSNNSTIRINEDLKNKLSIRFSRGTFIAKTLSNKESIIKINNSNFLAKAFEGGELTLSNVKRVIIGGVKNMKLESEFSKIEIGEVQENVVINGFNSTYWFHNWSDDFKEFKIDDEYSKINLFNPKSDYKLETYGFNTVLYSLKNASIQSIQNPNEEKDNLYSVSKGDGSNKISINIKHGIVRVDNEKIIINKN